MHAEVQAGSHKSYTSWSYTLYGSAWLEQLILGKMYSHEHHNKARGDWSALPAKLD